MIVFFLTAFTSAFGFLGIRLIHGGAREVDVSAIILGTVFLGFAAVELAATIIYAIQL